jgi:Fur family ferric uptake transcriptional regulator
VLRGAGRPLRVSELHDSLGPDRPDLVTVYRTLDRFVESAIAKIVHLSDGIRRYELADQRHHHHLTCTECGRIEPLPFCGVSSLENLALQKHGFRVTDHMLELFGTCRECTGQQQ